MKGDLQQVELVDNAQAHAAGLPLLLLNSIQRGMQHELVQILRPVIARAGLAYRQITHFGAWMVLYQRALLVAAEPAGAPAAPFQLFGGGIPQQYHKLHCALSRTSHCKICFEYRMVVQPNNHEGENSGGHSPATFMDVASYSPLICFTALPSRENHPCRMNVQVQVERRAEQGEIMDSYSMPL